MRQRERQTGQQKIVYGLDEIERGPRDETKQVTMRQTDKQDRQKKEKQRETKRKTKQDKIDKGIKNESGRRNTSQNKTKAP